MRNFMFGISFIVVLLFGVKAFCQIPSSSISSDCSSAQVNAINPYTGSTDRSTYTYAQINQAIRIANADRNIKSQGIAQDDVTLGLYLPLQQAIQSCLSNLNISTNTQTETSTSTGTGS